MALKHEERLTGVDAKLRDVVKATAKRANFDITVSEGMRTKERQAQLFKEGKTKTLHSKHLIGKAVDLYPLGVDGMINWNGFAALVRLMKISAAESGISITCGYDWGWDKPHFELK
ncbi:MAG: M15 family metallopeptidase [Bacteroidales bacterium]|jgi:peptidoglycan L-alanyl-D-glutamate endopeptidase CwlK|nr:M15 family metallopeptidase [Bacteroidales bacterium]